MNFGGNGNAVSSYMHKLIINFAILIYYVESFNLDSKFPVVISIPHNDYYFGYSVDMYTDNEDTWLLVGAPNARSGKGDIYLYKFYNNETEKVEFNFEKSSSATDTIPVRLGWTVEAAKNKQCLVCGPLFTVAPNKNSRLQYYDPIGICYLITNFMNPDREVYKVSPCSMARGTYHDGDDHGHCSAGFSAAFTKNGDGLLLGTPGSFYKQGSIMIIDLPITSDVNNLPIHIGESSPTPPEGWSKEDYLRVTYDDNYLGYSVATGQSPGNSPILVAGIPRRFGLDLLGMVVVYNENMKSQLYNFTGNQTGEYFGHSVTVVDFNNDNLDDIIVGAPLYTNFDKKLVENGRVFVYQQLPQADSVSDSDDQQEMLQFGEPLILEGTQDRAQFGHTVTCLGDINLDGYNDIGIGAPFATNGDKGADGALYIYNGGSTGLRDIHSQVIHGINISPDMKSFGFSISGEKDADHNEYPDVITGAYLANKAVLLRSRPVVSIHAEVTASPSEIDLENRECSDRNAQINYGCFIIYACFKYSGKGLPASLDIEYNYTIDANKLSTEKRAFLIDESPRKLILTSISGKNEESEESCVQETVYLQGDIKDKLNSMVIELSYALIEKNEPIEPVLNMLEEPQAFAHVEMAKDCGADNICEPDLKLTTTLDPKVVYVGAESPFTVTGKVTNAAEPSYETTFVLEYPSNVYYVGVTNEPGKVAPTCSFTESAVLCQVGNPLKRETTTNIQLKFSISGLTGNVSSLQFNAFVNSTNPVNSESNYVTFDMMVEVKSEVVIYNTTDPEIILLNKINKFQGKEINETAVQHIYQIRNNGPSAIKSAQIQLMWPYQNQNGDFLLEFDELKTDGLKCEEVPISLSSRRRRDNSDAVDKLTEVPAYKYYHCDKLAKCFTITCSLEDFAYRDEVAIYVISTLLIPTVNDQADAEIRSELSFDIVTYPYEINPGPGPTTHSFVNTLTTYDREPISQGIPWWIIALAIAAGVLVLFIVIVCLWKCGFFKRKKKHMTEQHKEQKQLLQNQKINEDEEALDNYLK